MEDRKNQIKHAPITVALRAYNSDIKIIKFELLKGVFFLNTVTVLLLAIAYRLG